MITGRKIKPIVTIRSKIWLSVYTLGYFCDDWRRDAILTSLLNGIAREVSKATGIVLFSDKKKAYTGGEGLICTKRDILLLLIF